jgi:hypothetical protein
MEECPVCQENVTLLNLSCSHGICRCCLSTWLDHGGTNCPMCRADIDQTILTHNFSLSDLIDSKIHYLNISISSPAYTSVPVTNFELSKFGELFGNASQICHKNVANLYNGRYIMFQMYRSNCWFFGNISRVEDGSIYINNCIFLNRHDGSIYNTTPSYKTLQYEHRDSIYLISI